MTAPGAQPDRDPDLAEICRAHPGWEAWRGVSRLFYARLAADHTTQVKGESTVELADMIRRVELARRQD